MSEATKKIARRLSGVVVSDKMTSSIVVKIERRVQHPKYKKFVRKTSKIHAHDPGNQCKEGDVVVIEECRPISKTKSWKLVEIKEKETVN